MAIVLEVEASQQPTFFLTNSLTYYFLTHVLEQHGLVSLCLLNLKYFVVFQRPEIDNITTTKYRGDFENYFSQDVVNF